MGNRTHDLLACSAMPQPTARPRAPLYRVGFNIPSELYNSASFFRWFTALLFSPASPFIYTPMSYWQSYSPRLTRRVLTLKICTVSEVGVNLLEKTYKSYETHVFVASYCSPLERCSVYLRGINRLLVINPTSTVPPLTRSNLFSWVDNSMLFLGLRWHLWVFQILPGLRIPFYLDVSTIPADVTTLPLNVENRLPSDAA